MWSRPTEARASTSQEEANSIGAKVQVSAMDGISNSRSCYQGGENGTPSSFITARCTRTSDRRQSRSVGYALRKIKNLERIPSFESAVTYIDLSTSLVKNYQG